MQEQSGGSKGIVAAVIVILILGGGYFSFNKYKTEHLPSPAPTPVASAQELPVLPKDASASAKPGEQITVTLLEQNKSHQAGIATLTEMGDKTRVQIRLAGATASAEPVHIHLGKCPKPGEVKYPLTDIVGGLSDTLLDVSLSNLKSMMPLAINVHKSKNEIQSYLACGDFQ